MSGQEGREASLEVFLFPAFVLTHNHAANSRHLRDVPANDKATNSVGLMQATLDKGR